MTLKQDGEYDGPEPDTSVRLTPRGVLVLVFDRWLRPEAPDSLYDRALEALGLHAILQMEVSDHFPAMVFDEGKWRFVEVTPKSDGGA